MLTFGELVLGYVSWLGPRQSASRYRQIYAQYFDRPEWRDQRARTITRYHVLHFKQAHESTPAQCSKGIGLIKQAYGWAQDRIDPATMRPYYDGDNPAWRVSKHDYIPRERLMDHTEIRVFLAHQDLLSPCYHALFVTRLLTPCRLTELCSMRWDAVEWGTGKWMKRLTKNKRPQCVLIPRQALGLLRQLPVKGDYVFPGAYGHPLQTGSAAKVWRRFRGAIGLSEDLQLLDFRRTLASYLYTEIDADELTAKAVLIITTAAPWRSTRG